MKPCIVRTKRHRPTNKQEQVRYTVFMPFICTLPHCMSKTDRPLSVTHEILLSDHFRIIHIKPIHIYTDQCVFQ